ncbi:hypothetical protein [Candidatus Bathycorpusculum sp.]|uniref:hypothetical protein n=1 Tax=Candidatus Bathycorpusculum sp. TaxID=2994959 RepID=UPI0028221D48|nr:hypothetical protein [Candidatus Termitimicrobium sp.]MCL2685960.1 hypothetical protein [Candidatus Termitimicrobium sp.]
MKRKFVFGIFFAMFMVCLCLPAFIVPLSDEQKADNVEVNSDRAAQATFTSIFGNNLYIALLALIPLAGVGFMSFALFNTGVIAASYPLGVLNIVGNPFAWIEVAVYAFACTCAYFALLSICKKDWTCMRAEFKRGVCWSTLILVISAFVEYLIIAGGAV